MAKPYTIKLFVPDGDPANFVIVNKMNWTGIGLKLSRKAWEDHKKRAEFDRAGVYLLSGYAAGSDLPTIYIGQGDGVKSRIESHTKNKDFWDKVVVFTTSNDSLNRAHITWLEWALIKRASEANRSLLDNSSFPNEPVMTESEKADTQEFLNELLSSLPLIDIPFFEKSEIITVKSDGNFLKKNEADTIVVPAQDEGFKEEFLKNNCWYAIRISGGKINQIRYIAAYQTAPISAITHYAEVDTIEPYGDGGKYKLNFKAAAVEIKPIPMGDAKPGSMQGPRYVNLEKMLKAHKLSEII
jgi:hypothetical protein